MVELNPNAEFTVVKIRNKNKLGKPRNTRNKTEQTNETSIHGQDLTKNI